MTDFILMTLLLITLLLTVSGIYMTLKYVYLKVVGRPKTATEIFKDSVEYLKKEIQNAKEGISDLGQDLKAALKTVIGIAAIITAIVLSWTIIAPIICIVIAIAMFSE